MTSPDPDSRKRATDSMRQVSLALELPFVLIAAVVVSGGLGYLLDRWLHTAPAFMLAGGAFGFAGGLWDILRQLSSSRRKGP